MPEAQYLPGNGITLCSACHKIAHEGFNGKPDLQLPMDAQGGEKIEFLAELYVRLLDDAEMRRIPLGKYYRLSEDVVSKFNVFQGFDSSARLSEFHLEHVARTWRHAPQQTLKAVFEANGFSFPGNVALGSDQIFVMYEDGRSEIIGQ